MNDELGDVLLGVLTLVIIVGTIMYMFGVQ